MRKQKLREVQKLPQVTQLVNGRAGIWICGVELLSPKSFSVSQICPSLSCLRTFALPFTSAFITFPSFHSLYFSSFKWKHHFLREAPWPWPLTDPLCGSPRFSKPLLIFCAGATFLMGSPTFWVSPGLLTPQAVSAFLREGRRRERANRYISLPSFSWTSCPSFPIWPIIWAIGCTFLQGWCQLGKHHLASAFPHSLPRCPGLYFPIKPLQVSLLQALLSWKSSLRDDPHHHPASYLHLTPTLLSLIPFTLYFSLTTFLIQLVTIYNMHFFFVHTMQLVGF